MKEEKVGLTSTNWILSILGIIILLSFIILPPVFRMLIKEETIPEPEKQLVVVGELVCTKDNVKDETKETNYIDSDALIINYKNNQLTGYTERIQRTYSDSVFYQAEKSIYGQYVTSFASIAGYQYSATPNDDTSTIMIVEKYDLSKFKPTTVVIENENNPIAITNHSLLMNTLNDTQNNLTTHGYVCEKNNEQQIEITP